MLIEPGFVFNNAGVFNNMSVLEATEEDWQFVLGVNVIGVASECSANISSVAGHVL